VRRRGKGGRGTASTRSALLRFGLASLLVAIAVGAVGAAAGRRAAREESIEDARRVTQVLAVSVVEPNVGPDLLAGTPEAVSRLDTVVRGRVTRGSLVRVKIWTPEGRIVYSDEHRLLGSTYALGEDEKQALTSGRPDAELSDLTAPENRFERGQGPMLEVYLPIRTPQGDVLLFETYSRYHEVVTAPAGSVWRDFLPITLGALLLLQLLQLPLVWGTARRLDRSVGERERLAREAVEASASERRRIAADLHDSVVQDLAAVSYSLSGAADRSSDGISASLRTAAATVRRSIQSLRTLLVEIYPDNLQTEGLAEALSDLSAQLRGSGVEVGLRVPNHLELPRATTELVFRVAAEALRNVAGHARATSAELTLRLEDGWVELVVADDGRGFDPDAPSAAGHLGLPLLHDRAQRAGGSLTVESKPRAGTWVRLRLPVPGPVAARRPTMGEGNGGLG
jgi:signal transduction histidine kinase